MFKTTLNEFKTRDKYIRVSPLADVSEIRDDVVMFLLMMMMMMSSCSSGRLEVQGQIQQTESPEDHPDVGGEGDEEPDQDGQGRDPRPGGGHPQEARAAHVLHWSGEITVSDWSTWPRYSPLIGLEVM